MIRTYCRLKYDRVFGGCQQLNRAEEAGWHQGGLARELADVGPGYALVSGQELVANDPVGPEVGDADDEHVPAGAGRAGQIHAPGRLPQDAEVLTVEDDFGQFMDLAEIKPESKAGGKAVCIKKNVARVLECAGVVF